MEYARQAVVTDQLGKSGYLQTVGDANDIKAIRKWNGTAVFSI